MIKFPCHKCGACCRQLYKMPEATRLHYGLDVKEDGACVYLDENNQCSIYDARPVICNYDKLAEELGVDKEEFFKSNAKYCPK